jgi:ABC-type Fe3+ transport system substrate-binding protein
MPAIRTTLVLVAALLAACAPAGGSPSPAPPRDKPAAAQPPAASAPAATGTQAAGAPQYGNAAEWERTKEAGKREGRVVVAGPGFPGLRNALVEGFQRAHGITVEYLGLSGAEAVSRVDREAKTGGPTLDVYMGGFTGCWTMAERDQIEDIRAYLLDPVALDPAGWTDGKPKLLEASPDMHPDSKCGLLNTQWVMTDLFVNRDLIPPASIRSWRDLLKPEYKGKIASFDPRRPGAAQTTVPYLSRLFGIDYLRDLYVGQEVVLTAEARQLAEWVARGAYPIGIALVQPAVEPLRDEGLPLERVFPTDGPGVLTPGSGSIMRIKNGPNPKAAAVFINWMASKEAQEIWEREMKETSRRTDVAHNVPEYVIPKPGVQYPVDAADPEQYFKYGAEARTALQQLLGR